MQNTFTKRFIAFLLLLAPLCVGATIIDNTDAGFTMTGTWKASHSVPGYYGSDYRYAATGSGAKFATWTFNIGSAGNYSISAQWAPAQAPWRASNAPYSIYNNGTLLATVTKDQTTAGGQFNPLGSYDLNAGTLEVRLTDNANNNYVVADAVQIVQNSSGGGSNQAPNGVIDSPTGAVTINVGESVNFASTGSDPDGDTPLSYRWEFGDPAIADSTQEDPGAVTFNTAGTYTVRLTVTDAKGLADPSPATVSVTVNEPGSGGGGSSSPTIIDNTDAGFTMTGTWKASHSVPGYYGSDYRYAATGSGAKFATWTFNIGSAGNYSISAQWAPAQAPWRASNAPYSIYNNGTLLATVTKDQTTAGGQFNPLGSYDLNAGTLEVRLTDNANNNYVVADAVQIVQNSSGGGSNQAPNGVIDSPTGAVTINVGESVNFASTGSDPDGDTPLSYRWEFGDPAIADSTQEDPGAVTFNTAGTYTVRLTVTDAKGLADPSPATVSVTVNEPGSNATVVTVDNTDPGFATSGGWTTSSSSSGYFGQDYRYAATGGGKTASWSFTIASGGKYDIYARWTNDDTSSQASNAKYKIENNGTLIATVTKDQSEAGGWFNLLGSYQLNPGTLDIKLTNSANNSIVIADATRIVKLPDDIQYYVAIGDSITWGYGDDDASDNVSGDGRDMGPEAGIGGFEPILNDLLTASTGLPHTIKNEGRLGITSSQGLDRLFPPVDILNRHPIAQRYLVLFGMNDARPWLPVPSGKGLTPSDSGYAGTFKDNMQQIIDAINSQGKEAMLAKIPIALGDRATGSTYPDPDNGARSLLIQEYNVVIDELKAIPGNNISVVPPDLYNYFRSRYTTEYFDNIHPNGVGYQGLANQWFNAITQ